MADDYTPTTQAVRLNYITANAGPYRGGGANAAAAFDRWLAAHDAAKRAEWEAEVFECPNCLMDVAHPATDRENGSRDA